jgi:phosphoglycolate phosphatase
MKLILFDIDGTILRFKDSLSRKVFSDIIEKILGASLPEDKLPSFAGMTDLKIIMDTADLMGISRKEFEELLPFFWDEMIQTFGPLCNYENLYLLPGITDLIMYFDQNPDYQLGLLTGNVKECAYLKLKPFALDSYFPFGAFGDEHYNRNVLPEIALLRANAYIGNDIFFPDNSIIIGDSPKDIECAKINGIKSLNVATGNFTKLELEDLGSDFCFEDFSKTDEVINKIEELL